MPHSIPLPGPMSPQVSIFFPARGFCTRLVAAPAQAGTPCGMTDTLDISMSYVPLSNSLAARVMTTTAVASAATCSKTFF